VIVVLVLFGIKLGFENTPLLWLAFALALMGIPIFIGSLLSGLTLIDGQWRRTYYHETLGLAEKHAGIGRWRVDHATGLQSWSDGLREAFVVAQARISNEAVARKLTKHAQDEQPCSFEIEVARQDGSLGLLRVFAQNYFSDVGKLLETFGVVVDVSHDREELRRAARAKQAAELEAEKANEMAMTDPLTGLANRRKAMAVIDRELIKARQRGSVISLVIFDIDHFKDVNDTYGHQIGDEILKQVASIAKQSIRAGEMVARIGGEEFVWLMPEAPMVVAERGSERLRNAIEQGSAVEGAPGVTVSIGYACSDVSSSSLTLFARADEALYAAKNGGRNMICMAA
jgi:diguanylate cyclase (GGDEF)-like protein